MKKSTLGLLLPAIFAVVFFSGIVCLQNYTSAKSDQLAPANARMDVLATLFEYSIKTHHFEQDGLEWQAFVESDKGSSYLPGGRVRKYLVYRGFFTILQSVTFSRETWTRHLGYRSWYTDVPWYKKFVWYDYCDQWHVQLRGDHFIYEHNLIVEDHSYVVSISSLPKDENSALAVVRDVMGMAFKRMKNDKTYFEFKDDAVTGTP